jgi:hypothetical protein
MSRGSVRFQTSVPSSASTAQTKPHWSEKYTMPLQRAGEETIWLHVMFQTSVPFSRSRQ